MKNNWTKEERERLITDIEDNFISDYLNFEDTSVGINKIYEIDKDVVNEINEGIEDCHVTHWSFDELHMECEGIILKIGLHDDLAKTDRDDIWYLTNKDEILN